MRPRDEPHPDDCLLKEIFTRDRFGSDREMISSCFAHRHLFARRGNAGEGRGRMKCGMVPIKSCIADDSATTVSHGAFGIGRRRSKRHNLLSAPPRVPYRMCSQIVHVHSCTFMYGHVRYLQHRWTCKMHQISSVQEKKPDLGPDRRNDVSWALAPSRCVRPQPSILLLAVIRFTTPFTSMGEGPSGPRIIGWRLGMLPTVTEGCVSAAGARFRHGQSCTARYCTVHAVIAEAVLSLVTVI